MMEDRIRLEMKDAKKDMYDLFNAAFFSIKGNNPIYNELIDLCMTK